ncbi:hypothetical protein PUN28_016165 [Cardiocondyla obscurior]|uniref:Uncharacterized protein n=1 Tax=Cardiocondyla obscurior TaxID=286306 RepID=A0AAW2EVK2_9HYME
MKLDDPLFRARLSRSAFIFKMRAIRKPRTSCGSKFHDREKSGKKNPPAAAVCCEHVRVGEGKRIAETRCPGKYNAFITSVETVETLLAVFVRTDTAGDMRKLRTSCVLVSCLRSRSGASSRPP